MKRSRLQYLATTVAENNSCIPVPARDFLELADIARGDAKFEPEEKPAPPPKAPEVDPEPELTDSATAQKNAEKASKASKKKGSS